MMSINLNNSAEISTPDSAQREQVLLDWKKQHFQLRFELSYFRLFVLNLPMFARNGWLDFPKKIHSQPPLPQAGSELNGARGFVIFSLPVSADLPTRATSGDFLVYVERKYPRYLTDLSGSFEDYQEKFSAKTRSTLKRKVKKFEAHCGGLKWRRFAAETDVDAFFADASLVSRKSYQEKLLENGLPSTADFLELTRSRARNDAWRAYVLYDADRPVAYLYCPVENGSLLYDYLGYDPEYLGLSPGTVLQWLALESIFAEQKFRFFDFTEGEGEHKKLFGTVSQDCATVLFLKNTVANRILVSTHRNTVRISTYVGQWADRYQLRPKLKKLLRLRK